MKNKILKDILVYFSIFAFFVVLSYAFVPDVLSGKVVNQSDISGWKGMAQETLQWNSQHPDDKAKWTDSMFGGMPNVTMFDDFAGDFTKPIYKLLTTGLRPANYLLLALVGAFLMMLSMGCDRLVSVTGAIAVAFCSYNLQIIQVGHNTKMQAIAWAPWVIAAFVFTYRQALKDIPAGLEPVRDKRRRFFAVIVGAVLFALALSMQIKANHVQITYYLAIILFVYVLAALVWVLMKNNRHKIKGFLSASVLLLVFGLVGIGTNANKLIPTAAYAPFTMRGGSELTGNKDINSEGLSIDYATQWSYGIEETPNLLIPNFNGGASAGALDKDSHTWKLLAQSYGGQTAQVCSNLPLYWGPQPFTAGPMYIGAISIFLFILGLILVKGKEKWWLLICVVLAVLLAWGSNFMWFTRLWFDYVPMYSKFRTVSMALVMLQFCVPLLGVCALDRIIKEDVPGRQAVRAIWISFGITAGLCLLMAGIMSAVGVFMSASDSQLPDVLVSALSLDRRSLMWSDTMRSFLLITITAAALIFSYFKNDSAVVHKRLNIAACVIVALVLFDLWSVGKRYLNSNDFLTPREFSSHLDERQVDKVISADKGLSYRVLDLSENTFNSSRTSYRHKSVGGYSPTKMQRYQDLIDHNLVGEISAISSSVGGAKTLEDIQASLPPLPVLSMLNTKYIIIGADYPPLMNTGAFGAAWFVEGCKSTATADDELAALKSVDLHNTAVVREGKVSDLPESGPVPSSATIEMTSYTPNELHYSYSCEKSCVAVFSEIYHPSWTAVLKSGGKETPLTLFQADWVLRGAVLPAGEGEIVMRYVPKDYEQGEIISASCSGVLLVLLLLTCLAGAFTRLRRQDRPQKS